MGKRKSKSSKLKTRREQVKDFQKSLVSFVLMLIFFAFLFSRTGVPSFVFFLVAIPWTISIIHKAIDIYHTDKQEYEDDIDDWDSPREKTEDQEIDLDDFKELRKEWKDSDFV